MVAKHDSQFHTLHSNPRTKHAPVWSLSALIAATVALGEVATLLVISPESFGSNSILLALATNFAALGLLGLLVLSALSPAFWALRAVTGASANSSALTFLRGCFAAGAMLAATHCVGWTARFSPAGLVPTVLMGAAFLTLVMGRAARLSVLRYAATAGWMACVAITVASVRNSHAHLRNWTAPPAKKPANAPAEESNILVVVLDTLRADRVGAYGDSTLTPNLDQLARSSIVYTQAISTAPWTLPMHASLFTGLYPHEHGVSWGHYRLNDRAPVLAELLKGRGYSTFAVSNNWLLSRENGFARGFDAFLETPNDPYVAHWRMALRCALPRRLAQWMGVPKGLADDAGSAWTNWLTAGRLRTEIQLPGPFFGFINYFEPHDPYHPPRAYLEMHLTEAQRDAYRRFRQKQDDLCAHACGLADTFSQEQIKLMAALYDAEVAYQDAKLGELIEEMSNLGLLDKTWLVVMSDHGELFGESDMVFHTAGSHYQLLHVPLMVRPPGGVEGRVVHAPVQPVDVFRRLVEIGGAELPEGVRRSHALPLTDEEPTGRTLCVSQTFGASITGLFVSQYRHMQVDVSRWMRWVTSVYADGFLLELDERGPFSLYDIRHDPTMTDNLVGKREDLVQQYLAAYRRWRGAAEAGESM